MHRQLAAAFVGALLVAAVPAEAFWGDNTPKVTMETFWDKSGGGERRRMRMRKEKPWMLLYKSPRTGAEHLFYLVGCRGSSCFILQESKGERLAAFRRGIYEIRDEQGELVFAPVAFEIDCVKKAWRTDPQQEFLVVGESFVGEVCRYN